jgi:small nuclear ribonucleoprotein (snRNP)-like protein
MGASSADDDPVAAVRAMLGRKLRVRVTDGRVFYGYLTCFDKLGNVMLENATECRPGAADGALEDDANDGSSLEAAAIGGASAASLENICHGTDEARHVGLVLIELAQRTRVSLWEDGDGDGDGAGGGTTRTGMGGGVDPKAFEAMRGMADLSIAATAPNA